MGGSGKLRGHYTLAEILVTEALPMLRLKKHEDRRLRAGHVWIFSNEVDTENTPLKGFAAGDIVRVVSDRDQFIGQAYVNPHALICARLLSRDSARPIGPAYFVDRLKSASALRERLYTSPHYRLVFGESDGLPGLVLDRFGDVIVGQIATAGMEAMRGQVEAAVAKVFPSAALIWKNDSGSRDLEQLPAYSQVALGTAPEHLDIVENDARFVAPLEGGQKTGWFYDQAANRAFLSRLVPRGARVLDVCSYVGAWGVAAGKAGASSVACVDSSQTALDFAVRNGKANGIHIEPMKGDAFDVLGALADRGERFDVVIVDPPAFAKRKKDVPKAEAAYRKLNQLALRLLRDDGILVSSSCSYHFGAEDLLSAIQSAARHTSRFVQILAAGGQAPDHPLHPAIPETRYLKTFFCRVTVE